MSEHLRRPTLPVQVPVPGPVNPGTSSLTFTIGKKVHVALYAYVAVPPIPNLEAHTQVEWRVDTGHSQGPVGWQVDWVQAAVGVRLGRGAIGTWMVNRDMLKIRGDNEPPHRWLRVLRERFLLGHEQGHYDISALLVRDYFNQVMALIQPKPKVFPTERDLLIALQDLQSETQALEATLRGNYDNPPGYAGLYDEETRHGRDLVKQEEWNALLGAAWRGRPLQEILKKMKKRI